MAEWTTEQIKGLAAEALALFDDGFQLTDLFEVVPLVMKVARDVAGTTGPERFALAVKLGEHIIDETDLWGPDAVIDPLLKKFLPGAIQMGWDFWARKHDLEPGAGGPLVILQD